jgi:hypothetical protein
MHSGNLRHIIHSNPCSILVFGRYGQKMEIFENPMKIEMVEKFHVSHSSTGVLKCRVGSGSVGRGSKIGQFPVGQVGRGSRVLTHRTHHSVYVF